ncbi:uncharacterized protein [Dermacentor albipictus]|uniref:uncharacterized protein isoform X1 n=1 Tax=Dermacentor albipictus TaxID=60249 RepID=UPI0038FCECCF
MGGVGLPGPVVTWLLSVAAERARSSFSPAPNWVGHASYVLLRSRWLSISNGASRTQNGLVYAVAMLQPGHKNSSTAAPSTHGTDALATWGSWSAWSECSRSCSLGVQTRTRHCLFPSGVASNFQALRRPAGSNATLHCTDAGRLRSRFPEATLHWEHDGRRLQLDQRRQLFTGGRLELTDLRPSDAGHYACWMETAGRPLPPVALVSLTVPAPPVIVAPGSCLVLLCRPPPPSAAQLVNAGRFEWHLNGSLRATTRRAGKMQTLYLPGVTEADSGLWECVYTGQDQSWALVEFLLEGGACVVKSGHGGGHAVSGRHNVSALPATHSVVGYAAARCAAR